MDKVEKMRAFIIKFLYVAILLALVYCGLKYAMPLFMPFVVAFGIAFVLKPVINKLSEKTPLSRKVSAILVLTLTYLVLITLLVLLGVRLGIFLGNLFTNLPAYYKNTIEPAFNTLGNTLDDFVARLDPAILTFLDSASESLSNAISSVISAISSWAVNTLGNIASSLPWIIVATLLSIIASYFFVVDYYKVTVFLTKQLSERGRHILFVIKDFFVNVLFKFLRAYFILMCITFAEVFIGLLILQVPGALWIAVLTALVDILPIFGSGTIMWPWAAYCLITGDYFRGIGLVVMYVAITIIRQSIEPRIVGKEIGLYPLLTLICMFVGARLFGFWGMFGFPITLTILIHLNRTGEIRLFKE